MSKSPLFDLAAALPEHLAYGVEAGRNLRGLPQRSDIENIVVLGMGAARTAGQVVRALGSPVIPVPILVESSCTRFPPVSGIGLWCLQFPDRETPTRSITPPRNRLPSEPSSSSLRSVDG